MGRMTRMEALTYCENRSLVNEVAILGPAFIQCELQLIWKGSAEPISEIMSLGFNHGEARKLWNARKSPPFTKEELGRMHKLSDLTSGSCRVSLKRMKGT